jgi:hypothetical protein
VIARRIKKNPCTKCEGAGCGPKEWTARYRVACSVCEGTGKYVAPEVVELRNAELTLAIVTRNLKDAQASHARAAARFAKAYEAVHGQPAKA